MLTSYRQKTNLLLAKVELLKESLQSHEADREMLRQQMQDTDEARNLFQIAASMTQDTLSHRLGDIVSLALASIWEEPYKLKIMFVPRRNTTECDMLFQRGAQVMNPFDSSGYGAIDIASMALRVSYWGVKPTRNCIIWDEPARQLGSSKHSLASKWLKTLSEEASIQFIIVSHQDELVDSAHKVFNVTQRNKVSRIS